MTKELSFSFSEITGTTEDKFADIVSALLARTFAALGPEAEQINAWDVSARWLHRAISALDPSNPHARVVFELAPPLEFQRSDFVILSKNHMLVCEAKTGNSESVSAAKRQVQQYAKTLWNFVDYSSTRVVVPVLIRPQASTFKTPLLPRNPSAGLAEIIDLKPEHLSTLLAQLEIEESYEATDPAKWLFSPRPDIISAARIMLGQTSDRTILTALTDDDELRAVIEKCEGLASSTKSGHLGVRHAVIAVTGVPGAGKTLVGLRLSHSAHLHDLSSSTASTPPLYLSGNGPLVDVLSEALVRDQIDRTNCSREEAETFAKAKVRLVHGLTSDKFAVRTHVLIFDEAQRAWSEEHMVRKLRRMELGSEAEEILKRMEDDSLGWSVVICLVGTGQQINSGEEGLKTWLEAIERRRMSTDGKSWVLFVDPHVAQSEGISGNSVRHESALNLNVVRRANNASALAEWVNLVLESKFESARELRKEFEQFPLHVCRDIDLARDWLRRKTKRFETCGLVASSKSARLSVYGVDAHTSASDSHDWPQWYLDQPPNLNSSKTLEVAASEFKCQGLELDWVGVCWSWDLVNNGISWVPRRINRRSGRWNKNSAAGEYLINAYRVLLTRARSGMVIWVPQGVVSDLSRSIDESDTTFELLRSAGCSEFS